MKHLWEDWEKIQQKIRRAQSLFLLLDYDGTLAPIAPTPEEALCPPEVKVLLEKLRDHAHALVAIISGRSLDDLKEKVGVSGIIYVGNHGLEIQNPAGIHKKKLSPPREKELQMIVRTLRRSLGGIQGILMEEKGPIVAVHYRNVAQKYFGLIHRVLKETLERWGGRWKTAYGKMVVEIRPEIDFHKGKAVRELLRGASKHILPIYLGDDQTDEEAFREVKGRGITVLIGPGWRTSEAEYFLKNPEEVEDFLRRCQEVLLDRS
jgi:trehalose-phosphatase